MKRLKQWFKRLSPMKPNEVSPRVFLEEMLENCDNFKSVMVVIHYKDDSMDCDWSQMATNDLAQACIVLDEQMRRCIIARGAQ